LHIELAQESQSLCQASRQCRRDQKQKVMKKSTKNKVRMFDAVRTVLTAHQSSWSENQGFEAGVTQLNLLLDEMQTIAVRQGTIYEGVKTRRSDYLRDLGAKTMVLRNGLEVMAHDNKLPEVYESIQFTEFGLINASQQELRQHLARVYELTVTHEAAIVVYGVTPTHIANFLELYQQFESEIVALRHGLIERKFLTNRMYSLEKEVMSLFKKKIDVLMKLIAVEHPEFFEQYKSARIVIEKSNYKSKEAPPNGEEDIGVAS
jgi:precorrin isomerase